MGEMGGFYYPITLPPQDLILKHKDSFPTLASHKRSLVS